MLAGVPSLEDAPKNRVAKDRVLDGPTELSISHSDSTRLKADSFSVTSSVNLLGFREMLELCKDAVWLSHCACNDKTTELASLEAGQVFTIRGSNVEVISPNALNDYDVRIGEYAICFFPNTEGRTRGEDATWIFHVTKNPAARWLQMDNMVRNTFFWEKMDPRLFIRNNETCMLCGCKFCSESGSQNPHSLVLL